MDSFIFPSTQNIFVNKFYILVSQSEFSDWYKPLFYLFLRHWKCIFETNSSFWLVQTDIVASGSHFVLISQVSSSLETFCPFRGNIF